MRIWGRPQKSTFGDLGTGSRSKQKFIKIRENDRKINRK